MENTENKNIIDNENLNNDQNEENRKNQKKYIQTRITCEKCNKRRNTKKVTFEDIDGIKMCSKCKKRLNYVDGRSNRYNDVITKNKIKKMPKINVSCVFKKNNTCTGLIMKTKTSVNTIEQICKNINDMNDFIKKYNDYFNPFSN